MSKALKDLRAQIEEHSDMWLEIEATTLGADKQAIVRRVLREWAKAKDHAYTIATKRLKAHGAQMELYGADVEDDGIARKGAK